MNPKIFYLLGVLVFTGCEPSTVVHVEAGDPDLIRKLGISEPEWTSLQQLSLDREGFTIVAVNRLHSGEIDVELKAPSDRKDETGGPIDRYEKREGVWTREPNASGRWVNLVTVK